MAKTDRHYAGKRKFGVHVPPQRRQPPGENVTLEFVIPGWIPSKKNMQVPFFDYDLTFRRIRNFYRTRENEHLTVKEFMKFTFDLVRNIRPYIMNPKKYTQWHEENQKRVLEQAAHWLKCYQSKGLRFPISRCSVHIRHSWADKHRRDNSNKAETIHDLLVSSGIIIDDSYTCMFKNSTEADCMKGEITDHVTQIFVTAYRW